MRNEIWSIIFKTAESMLTFEGQQFVGAEAIVKKLTVSCLLNSKNQ